MAATDPAVRSENARMAANARWAKVTDRSAATADARAAILRNLDAQIPAEVTDPAQRASMLQHALKLRMAQIRKARNRAQRLRQQARAEQLVAAEQIEQADQALRDLIAVGVLTAESA